jgi:hypothetical protein
MPLHRAVALALLLSATGLAGAKAQEAGLPGQTPTCLQKFLPLRQDVEKRMATTQAAINRKAPATELCRLFTQFAEAETKMIKYVEDAGLWCGFPPDALPGMKANHAKALDYRKQACNAAAAGAQQRPAAPSLSDALTAPIPDASTTRTGRGTLDSLTGNPLAR